MAKRRLSPSHSPRILLTNDDGIHAPGLMALHAALCAAYPVCVVAPEVEMSAVGHAITLSSPLRVREVHKGGDLYGYAVNGTPADCVKIAMQELFADPPEMVLSGINLGANIGVNVLYSGTVSAATEAAFLGVPAAAVSLNTRKDPDFGFAARFAVELAGYMQRTRLPAGVALNVNIPALPPEQIQGIALTRQGTARFEERFERRTDPRGNLYYWLAGETFVDNGLPGTDARALREKRISITPIHYDLTSEKALAELRRGSLAQLKIPPPAQEQDR